MRWSDAYAACKKYSWQLLVSVALLGLLLVRVFGQLFRRPDEVSSYVRGEEARSKELAQKAEEAASARNTQVQKADAEAEKAVAQEVHKQEQQVADLVEDPQATTTYLQNVGKKIRGG